MARPMTLLERYRLGQRLLVDWNDGHPLDHVTVCGVSDGTLYLYFSADKKQRTFVHDGVPGSRNFCSPKKQLVTIYFPSEKGATK